MKAAVKVLGNMLEPGKNKVIDMTAQSTNGQEGNSCPKFFGGNGGVGGWGEGRAKIITRFQLLSLPNLVSEV